MFVDKTFKYLLFIASVCLTRPFAYCEEYTVKSYSEVNMPSNEIIKEVDRLLNIKGTNLISNHGTYRCILSYFNRLFVSTDDKDHVVGCCFVVSLPHFLTIETFIVEKDSLIDKIGNALICKVEDFAKDSKMLGIVLQPASMSINFFKKLGYVDSQIILLRMIKYLN